MGKTNDPSSFIDENKRYEYVTKMLFYLNDKIIESFNLFLKIYSALVGGIIWLSIQDNTILINNRIYPVIPYLFILIGVFSIVSIINNLRIWFGYRKVVSNLVGIGRIPLPKFPKSCISELSMITLITIATIIGVFFIKP